MRAARSEDSQAVLLDAAAEAVKEHPLRALRLLHDAERLGPMNPALRARYDRLMAAVDPLRDAA